MVDFSKYVTPDDSLEWSKLTEQISARGATDRARNRQQREQSRQHDDEQARLRDQAAMQDRQAAQQEERLRADLMLRAQKQAYDKEQDRLKTKREGIQATLKAWREAETLEEFDGARDMLTRAYGITAVPRGSVPPEAAAQVAAEASAQEQAASGVPPPPGMDAGVADPWAPGSGAPTTPSPPSPTASAVAAAGRMESASQPPPMGIAPEPYTPGSPESKRRDDEEALMAELPPGKAASAEGLEVSQIITSGAEAVAQAAGIADLGTTTDVPAFPAEAPDATQAEGADKMNPEVRPAQQMPAKDYSDLSIRLGGQKPVTRVEKDDRMATDAQIEASFQKRMGIIDQMGLSPAQRAAAANRAAAAHGLPPIPVPPPAIPDPTIPLEIQGTGAIDVTLPGDVLAITDAPPELMPSVVRDGRTSGGFDFYDSDTGENYGSLDWASVQEARVQKRREDWQPIVDIADNESDKKKLQKAVETFALSGNEKSYDLLMAYLGRLNAREVASVANQRQGITDARANIKDLTTEMRTVKDQLIKEQGLVAMQENIQRANRTVAALEADPNSTQQRTIYGELLKSIAGSRFSDQDARMFGKGSFWEEVEEMKNYVLEGGELAGERLERMKRLNETIRAAEYEKRQKMATALHYQVMNSVMVQGNSTPEQARTLAEQAILEAFPDLTPKIISHSIRTSLAQRRERYGDSLGGGGGRPRRKLEDIKPDEI